MKTFPIQLEDELWGKLKQIALDKRVPLKALITKALEKLAKAESK